MKAEKIISSEDVSDAMDELRESAQKIIMSMGNVAKSIDWRNVAPKIVMGLVLLYGIRHRKLLSSIVSSMIIGTVTNTIVPAVAEKK